MNAAEMYQEIILDHYRNPRNFGIVKNANLSFRDSNPSCGDIIEITLLTDRVGIIKEIKFSGKGCAISQASTSMLTEYLKGKNIKEVKTLKKEEILEMLSIELSPIRLKCALLGLKVIKMAAYNHLGEKLENENDYT